MDRFELARRLDGPVQAAEPRDAVVCAAEPQQFRANFAAAVAGGGTVFVADPAWGEVERAQFAALIRQGSIGRDPGEPGAGWLCLPTGGSSGAIKLARHDEATLGAAVRGFAQHFNVPMIHALGVLPLHHVSGLMAWLRCALTGGRYESAAWADIVAGRRPDVRDEATFFSLVPTQLARLLEQPAAVDWLRRFRAVFIGGGPSWPELVERAAEARLPLAFSYGSTETAAMVTALRPTEFLAGQRGSGRALPHATVTCDEEGRLRISASSLFRGYWPAWREGLEWSPGDFGRIDAAGSVHIHGRADALIISGGEKIDPGEVEAALRATGAFADVAVVGVSHPVWGREVVACYPLEASPPPDRAQVEVALAGRLAKFKWPKRYVAVAPWPRNAQGKVSRERLREAAAS